ncbi:MAG: hypothetical protein LW878_14240, partial [Proteobacteria bacterium]|nr:hypothetical protein [Pseudomonadota bacterium]
MTGKPKPMIAPDMGLSENTKNVKFLDHPSHEFIQSSFDSIFPRFGTSFKAKESAVSDEDSTRVQSIKSKPEEANLDELDFGLGLSDESGNESLNESPADQGLDLGASDDLELSLGDDSDFSSSVSAASGDELTLGEDIDPDDDVMSKLAEIDEIMEADATNTMLRPNSQQLNADQLDDSDEVLSLDGDLFLGDEDVSFSLGDDGPADQGLELGGDDSFSLGDESSSDDLSLGSDDEGLESLDDDLFSSPIESSAPKKKPLPAAPKIAELSASDEDGAEEFSFTTNADDTSDEIQVAAAPVRQTAPEAPVRTARVAAPEAVSAPTTHVSSTSTERNAYKEVVGNYGQELERLQATLNHLRMDREGLVKKITDLEEEKIQWNRNQLTLRAELDEKKIEIQIMKKRMSEESQDLKYQYELEQERRKLAEEKAKAFQLEAVNMQQKVKQEIKKVSSRERELEQRLELLKVDAETQIRHRDMKILELKRKIDTMEFDIDTLTANEQRNIGDKGELEDKLDKAIKTLRAAIGILETDDPKLATLER